MTTAVAINRPSPPGLSSPFADPPRPSSFSGKDVVHVVVPSPSATSATISCGRFVAPAQADELEARLRDALRDRDEQWRRHEKAQITFLQNETSSMLKGLHAEVERLAAELRIAKRELFVQGGDSAEVAEENARRVEKLEKTLQEKEAYTKNIEKKVTVTIEKLQEQIVLQGERIRQLSEELNDRNQTVAHLSGQLRQIRLREAMAAAQHRRRASQTSSPTTSPCSPHRIFPPGGSVVSASVSVSYPHELFLRPRESPGSIEKPPQRRSFSAVRAPQLPR